MRWLFWFTLLLGLFLVGCRSVGVPDLGPSEVSDLALRTVELASREAERTGGDVGWEELAGGLAASLLAAFGLVEWRTRKKRDKGS